MLIEAIEKRFRGGEAPPFDHAVAGLRELEDCVNAYPSNWDTRASPSLNTTIPMCFRKMQEAAVAQVEALLFKSSPKRTGQVEQGGDHR